MSMGCEPSRIFHERVFYSVLDHKLGLTFKAIIDRTTDFADELLRRTQIFV